jgi:hypothetical protein
MEAESVCETPVFKSTLALLIAREDFSKLASNLKYNNISHLMLLEIVILDFVHHLNVLPHH